LGARPAESLLRRALSPVSVAALCLAALLPPIPASARLDARPQPVDRKARDGGTLRVATPLDPGPLDPALAKPAVYPLWFATCAMLTAVADTADATTSELRAEAAAGPPQISRDRRTYVFTVRKALRFSNGTPLSAANYAVALGRVVNPAMHSDAAFLYADVKRVKASGRRLRIELKTPSGDLAARLALPFACPVPLGFPVDLSGVDLMVGSGPYYVARNVPDKLLVLARNRYYRGARPHHPDRIVVSVGGDLDDNIRAVESGAADVLGIEIPRDVRIVLARRYGVDKRQFFRVSGTFTEALVLNTARPLFRDNVPLRKAVNLAIDRSEMVRSAGISVWGTPTDQIVPSRIAGWRDYHIYPLDGSALARARTLAAGHLRDGKAVLYATRGPGGPEEAALVAHELGAIGLDVTVKLLAVEVINAKAGIQGEPYDMILASFPPGSPEAYPDPSMMLVRLLAGANSRQPSGNTNFAYFDNPTYNRRLAAADRLSGLARARAFSRLDADIMRNQAPWAPLWEGSNTLLVSKRVGCLKVHPVYIRDLAAMCVTS
jgi:peptide/nickel transport system substrate-binding protein